ncbi:hypothetical protein BV360_00870 [Pseudomonas syringae pv. actinidiae]|uniref:Uncharacterized protein n=1 Tax=Pseudomonas syringae pv. actinidiae TaxID=103796 RepID=A0AAN4Q559_PSESF|nr:hypothetical protein BV340_00860 [Pseudomonas syringae pv. actinidiae]OSN23874.1 hypothetical protein BV339_00916 [Pseudomonas syringae pv. actinidiae]OSN28184.1 hypothetical protein BV341_00865 [Pseudomonas syringae pv. actinidiae]OSN37621.1 hypothetical protein BV343_00935 [Pseudomonas syringae pv. actinidiae]OSN39817.1 hypothetical protein BV342_00950 [Pseudomonas syringae pv. actinidiae]
MTGWNLSTAPKFLLKIPVIEKYFEACLFLLL